jgi:hypothetical protein
LEIALIIFSVVLGFGLLIVTPAFLFRPLIIALADRIAGKKAGNADIKELRERVARLEGELMEVRCTVIEMESSQEFTKKLTDESQKPTGTRKE